MCITYEKRKKTSGSIIRISGLKQQREQIIISQHSGKDILSHLSTISHALWGLDLR